MSLLDLIFPKKCVNCKRFGEYLCADCFAKIRYNESLEPVSGELNGVLSVVNYNGVTRKLIRQFKYKPHVSRLSEIIGEIMNEGLAQNESFYQFIQQFKPVIVPIPLSSKRLRERGYNHAEIIGRHVAKYFNLVMSNKLLVRIKDTKPQYRLSRKERFENIRGAFDIIREQRIPDSIILIDDLATSLATLKEAAKVLKRNGSKRVLGVTFAREI